MVLLKRAIDLNSVSGLCLTKLDVLDGVETLKIAVSYKDSQGKTHTYPPCSAEEFEGLEPVYESLPGWHESTADVTELSKLPANALAYIKRIEALAGIPVDILSTGPERAATLILKDVFA